MTFGRAQNTTQICVIYRPTWNRPKQKPVPPPRPSQPPHSAAAADHRHSRNSNSSLASTTTTTESKLFNRESAAGLFFAHTG